MCWGILISKEPVDVLIYFLIYGIPKALPLCVLIFFIYYFISGYILTKFASGNFRWVLIIALCCTFFLIIVVIDWLLLRELFYTFFDFIKEANFYLIFTVITMLLVLIYRVREQSIKY